MPILSRFAVAATLCASALYAAPAAIPAPVADTPAPAPTAVTLAVDTEHPVCTLSDTLFGIFIEDVNGAVEGGLYAEMVKNRSFDYKNPLAAWGTHGDVEIRDDNPAFKNNPRYVRMQSTRSGPRNRIEGAFLVNEGFWGGMGARKGELYRARFWARAEKPVDIGVYLAGDGNRIVAKLNRPIKIEGAQWKRYDVELFARDTEPHARFVFAMESDGTLDVDHISLFPKRTWMNRENGLRADLMGALNDLRPGHFRFPGGCIVEGFFLADRYQWKKTVGPVEERGRTPNMWEFSKERFTPDYIQSFGLGFYEYFLMCEDMGAEPLPILNCGISCQGRASETEPLDRLQPYLQDALDLVEFANGAPDTRWGAVRARMGHPEPFGMRMIGIGNEQRGEIYPPRLEPFVKLLRDKHPELKIVACSGDTPDYDALNAELRRMKVDYRDEHYYKPSQWFFDNAGKFDTYDRTGPKIYLGEYAVCDKLERQNKFGSALAEAAFMTGIERNGDIVGMACYAPLLANPDAMVWSPNLIYFNALDRLLTSNYYVQKLFSQHQGGRLLRLSSAQTDLKGGGNLYASATEQDGDIVVKIVNANRARVPVSFEFPKGVAVSPTVEAQTLQSDDLNAENTFDAPNRILPRAHTLRLSDDGKRTLDIEGRSVNVLRFKRLQQN